MDNIDSTMHEAQSQEKSTVSPEVPLEKVHTLDTILPNLLNAGPTFYDDPSRWKDMLQRVKSEGIDIVELTRRLYKSASVRQVSVATSSQPEKRAIVRNMDEIERKSIDWLWWPYLPKSSTVLLTGDPGIGKSLLTIQLACTLSRGGCLPSQQGQLTFPTTPQHTLLLSAEDAVSEVIATRIDRAGGNDSKIHILEGFKDSKDEDHFFTFHDMKVLEDALRDYAYGLVIIDPIQAYLGKMDMHRANEVRPMMAALARVAQEYSTTILCVCHTNKQGGGNALDRTLGSRDFGAAVRAGLFVERHPMDENKVLLGQIKNNYDRLGRTQIFDKREGKFTWSGISRLTGEMIGGNERGPDPHAFMKAMYWLEAKLSTGTALLSKDIYEDATEEGIAPKTLERAKGALGVKSVRQGEERLWQLPPLEILSPPPLILGQRERRDKQGQLDQRDDIEALPSGQLDGQETLHPQERLHGLVSQVSSEAIQDDPALAKWEKGWSLRQVIAFLNAPIDQELLAELERLRPDWDIYEPTEEDYEDLRRLEQEYQQALREGKVSTIPHYLWEKALKLLELE